MVLRDMVRTFPRLRVILMSATVDIKLFSEYFGNIRVIEVQGRVHPVQGQYPGVGGKVLRGVTPVRAVEVMSLPSLPEGRARVMRNSKTIASIDLIFYTGSIIPVARSSSKMIWIP